MRYIVLGALALLLLVIAGCNGGLSPSPAANDNYTMSLVRYNDSTQEWEHAPLNGLCVGDLVDIQVDKRPMLNGTPLTRDGLDYTVIATRPNGTEATAEKGGWVLDEAGRWSFEAYGIDFYLQIKVTVAPQLAISANLIEGKLTISVENSSASEIIGVSVLVQFSGENIYIDADGSSTGIIHLAYATDGFYTFDSDLWWINRWDGLSEQRSGAMNEVFDLGNIPPSQATQFEIQLFREA